MPGDLEKRGNKQIRPLKAGDVTLPPRPFLYTIDQVATILNLTEESVKRSYLYLEGRSIGFSVRSLMIARNIAPDDERPDWRIAEYEFIRWMKWKGFRHYDRGYFTH